MRATREKFFSPAAYIEFLRSSARWWPAAKAIASNWPTWILRQFLRPVMSLHCWIYTRAGTRFCLGDDHVDDIILRHIMRDNDHIYFPPGAVVPPGSLIVDVGAHHGMYATEILRRNPGAHLIAIEPNPEARAYFTRNLAANQMLGRVEYIEAGLADRAGEAILDLAGESWEHSTLPLSPDRAARGVVVPMITMLDALAGRYPYLVKLNAEGAEFQVIPDLFAHGIHPAWLVLMIHPSAGGAEDLLSVVAKNGYEIRPADGRAGRFRVHCRLDQQTV